MSLDLDYGLAAFSEFIEGVLCVAVDLYGPPEGGEGTGRALKSMQPLGLLARPLDPATDPATAAPVDGAGCLYGFIGDEGWSMPTTDPRLLSDVPEIEKGSTLLYGPKQFLYFNGETRDVTLFQRVGDSEAQALTMVATEGSESVQIRHKSGSNYAMLPDGSVLINAETASNFIQVTNDGVVISGLLKLAGGAVLGDVVGAKPVALAPEIAIWATAVNLALTAIAGLLNAPGPVTGAPGAVTPPPPLSPSFAATKVAGS